MIQRNSLFLMANLGSEVSKIISAKKKNDQTLLASYLEQAEKILKDIMTMPDMKSRESEIKTLTEVIEDIAKPKPKLTISNEVITSYFMPFAVRLMGAR